MTSPLPNGRSSVSRRSFPLGIHRELHAVVRPEDLVPHRQLQPVIMDLAFKPQMEPPIDDDGEDSSDILASLVVLGT